MWCGVGGPAIVRVFAILRTCGRAVGRPHPYLAIDPVDDVIAAHTCMLTDSVPGLSDACFGLVYKSVLTCSHFAFCV